MRLANISYQPSFTDELLAINKNVLFTILLINSRFFDALDKARKRHFKKNVHAHSNASQTVYVRCNAESVLIKQYAIACALGFLFLYHLPEEKSCGRPSKKGEKAFTPTALVVVRILYNRRWSSKILSAAIKTNFLNEKSELA